MQWVRKIGIMPQVRGVAAETRALKNGRGQNVFYDPDPVLSFLKLGPSPHIVQKK